MYSSLTNKVYDFGNHNCNPRGSNKILKITPHHMAGKQDPLDCAKMHYNGSTSSANYYIGNDGTIVGGVSEDKRAWTSGNRDNDYHAITFEVANSTLGPDWKISDAAYKALVALSADICKRYNIDPYYNGVNGTITMHKEVTPPSKPTSCPGPYVENLIKSGKFEKDVRNAMNGDQPTPTPEPAPAPAPTPSGDFKEGDIVKLKEGATYYNGKAIPSWVFNSTLYYRGSNKNGAIISTQKTGAITGVVNENDLIKVSDGGSAQFKSYKVRIAVGSLNVRKGPGTQYPVTTVVSKGEVFTIVGEDHGWGQLKSGVGYISLNYTEKI